ncbi:hypothetical protein KAI65_00210 [Candidatus Parcubacteria bacterium]|nr:hypothetical protein [Candidatus Parcubacteria bacterium]
MDNLEKQLNNLPKKKLDMRADYLLRFKFYRAMWQKKVDMYVQYFSFKRHLPPLAAALVLISLIVGIPGYAYANENITAVHYLYGVKKTVEKVELALVFSEKEKQEKQEKLIVRRLNEAEILSQNTGSKKYNLALVETINEAMKLREELEEEIKAIKKQEVWSQNFADKNTSKNKEKEIKEIQTLTQIANTVGIKAEEEILDVVAETLEAVKKTQPNKEKKKNINNKPRFESQDITASSASLQNNDIKQTINTIQDEIKKLNDDLENNGYLRQDVKILNKHLEKKIKKAKDAIEKNNINAAKGIINTTEALTNNAKYFLKEKKNNNSKPEKSNKKK